MQTDAIQQDVSMEGAGGVDGAGTVGAATGSEPVLSPRELAMQEISQQLLESEAAAGFGVVTEATDEQAAVKLPEVLAEDQLAEVRVKVKVDGVEVEMPLSEVTKGYQKDVVASRRLAQAAEERKKLTAWENELKSREAALVSGDTLSSAVMVEDTDAQIKAAMAALVEGDEVAAAAALKSIIGNGRQETTQPVIDEDAIVAKAETRIENKKAWADFVGSNPAFADEASKQRQYGDYLFDSVFSPLVAAGELSYREALMKTADEVNQVFTPTQTPRQQKEERTSRIDNLPVAAGARAEQAPNKVRTPEEVLDEMRKARGQFV